MENLLNILKQRRIWAGITGAIALFLPLVAKDASFDANATTDAIMRLVEALSGIATIILPLYSYFKPKAN